MMRRTRLTFLAALGLYVAALLLPRDAPETTATVPLDMTGIDELEVVSDSSVNVRLDAASANWLDYPPGKDHHVTVTREGRRLRIVSDVPGYRPLNISIRPTVGKLVVRDASIVAGPVLEAMVVETTGAIEWRGSVTDLTVVDLNPWYDHAAADPAAVPANGAEAAAAAAADAFAARLDIESGRIQNLSVTTRGSVVTLADPDTLGRITLTLGQRARYSIGSASRIPDITLLPHPADAQAPEAKQP
ncbi:MAG TPA: hypothetical protein PLG89_04110 [Arenimonas sp.]|nr:hypothetical protein [Arenimonas sp.]